MSEYKRDLLTKLGKTLIRKGVEIDTRKVKSSNIARIGYDPESKRLEVEFKGGGVYQYFPVSLRTFHEFEKAESKGQFFHSRIKDRFPYRKIG